MKAQESSYINTGTPRDDLQWRTGGRDKFHIYVRQDADYRFSGERNAIMLLSNLLDVLLVGL